MGNGAEEGDQPVTDAARSLTADFVVVANRLPVDLERLPDGTQRWKSSPGLKVQAGKAWGMGLMGGLGRMS